MTAFLRLCRSELHRLFARGLTRLLAFVYVVVIVIFFFVAFTHHSTDPNAGRVAAERQQAQFMKDCLSAGQEHAPTPSPDGTSVQEGPSAADCANIQVPVQDKRWRANDTADAVKGMLGAGAVLAFILGASAGGAEWAARTIQALLLWEPRRVRVIAGKIVALSVVVTCLVVAAQVLVLAATWVLSVARGTTSGYTAEVWRHIAASQGRGLALAIIAGAFAFSISSFTRNTGAALGVAFGYFVILEQVIRVWQPKLTDYLLTPNVAALLSGRITVTDAHTSTVITSGRAGLVLTAYAALVLALATSLFVRRDVT
jgi:hypothetical protein